ncbi:hypothetical protein ACHAW6_002272 [Cyclotella cf. meneghiniana]
MAYNQLNRAIKVTSGGPKPRVMTHRSHRAKVCRGGKMLGLLVALTAFHANTNFDFTTDNQDGSKGSHRLTSSCPQTPCHISLAFMGDSLSRYMYYSLVYYLRNGVWIDPNSSPSLVRPADFVGGYELNFDWYPWFNASTSALAPYEKCDCYRAPGSIVRGPGRHTVVENRYYEDPIRNNTVFYLASMGNLIPIRGHYDVKLGISKGRENGQEHNFTNIHFGPRRSADPFLWTSDWPNAIREQVAMVRPEYLILNAGNWPNNFDKPEFVKEVAAAIKDANIPRAVWRTTTPSRGGKYKKNWLKVDTFMCQNKSYWPYDCLDATTWTMQLDSKYYVDEFHFKEPIYRKMNEQLFDFLQRPLVRKTSPYKSEVEPVTL